MLDETTAKFWPDSDLLIWINDACRDMARRAEVIQSLNTSITVVAGTAKYNLPTNVIKVHRIVFVPTGQTQEYPLEMASYELMDSVWGVNPSSAGNPQFAIMWGFPPSLQVQLYPVPSTGGTLNVYMYQVPTALAADGDIAQIPEGWDDAVVDYCVSEAKRKDHDPTWQESRALYENKVTQLISLTRAWHDQTGSIQARGGSYVPSWLYGGD